MAHQHLLKAEKPLKILTIDGGGLQAIATLLVLDKLLDAIAIRNGETNRRPRPCDVFDTIAGIGAGGVRIIYLYYLYQAHETFWGSDGSRSDVRGLQGPHISVTYILTYLVASTLPGKIPYGYCRLFD